MYSVYNLTESAGTDIIAVCPPRDTDIPVLTKFTATAGNQAGGQKLYICSAVGVVENKYMIGQGQTDAVLTSTGAGSDSFAAGDIFVATNRLGGHEALEVASVSGNDVTFVSGPTTPIATRSLLYAFYHSSDSGQLKFPPVEPNITSPYRVIPANSTLTLSTWEQAGRDPQSSGEPDSFNSEGCPMILVLTNNGQAGSIDLAVFDWIDRSNSVTLRLAAGVDADAGGDPDKVDGGPVSEE